jgi:DDE superfamily endonuclease
MTKEAYKQGRIRNAQHDGNREFISLLACICADGTATAPALIYQGTSNDLHNTWIEDLNERDKAYFTASANGWTNNELGLAWLRRFHQDTKHKGSRRRLLILDGHSSHINMAFLSLADSLRILILILPPHTTHRLQPLNVGLFSPLAKAYTKRLDAYIHGWLGWVSMTKRLFWPIFRDAWGDSFTPKNIKKAFKATGIWPLQPLLTLAKIQKPSLSIYSTPTKLPPLPIATPMTTRGVRRLLKSSPTQKKVAILERAVLQLVTQMDIQNFENRGLRTALTQEKKRRQRGKRLNLLGEEDTGVP